MIVNISIQDNEKLIIHDGEHRVKYVITKGGTKQMLQILMVQEDNDTKNFGTVVLKLKARRYVEELSEVHPSGKMEIHKREP